MHLLKGISLVSLTATLATATTTTSIASSCSCTEVSFQVSATSQNVVFLSPPNQNNETAVLDFFYVGLANGTGPAVKGTTKVSGVFTIKGNYCVPTPHNDKNVLEILVHGISYNKSVWSGLGLSSTYNWQLYAASQGYSTLAIDRLGHGSDPQHPDPLNVVQGYLHIEIIHQMIKVIRTTQTNALGRIFKSVIWVSHSYAGWLGTGLVSSYPTDVDAMVLTGFSAVANFTIFETTHLVSASILDPVRFPGLPLGYITYKDESQRQSSFYAGGYSQAVAEVDYLLEDTWTIGETGNLGFVVPATKYTNPLFVVTGVEDVLFCETPLAACEAILNSTHVLFPGVTNFAFSAINNTGHTLMMHYSAQETFGEVHEFLDTVFPTK